MGYKRLNSIFKELSAKDRIKKISEMWSSDQVMITSSFGITSDYLINLIVNNWAHDKLKSLPRIYFIDTKYLFKETYEYKELLRKKYSLPITHVYPDNDLNNETTENKTWRSSPTLCCSINKVFPIKKHLHRYNIWISGLLPSTKHRENLEIFQYQELGYDEEGKQKGIIRCYPLLHLKENKTQLKEPHPLKEKGYGSVGCTHCTIKGKDRSGRWSSSIDINKPIGITNSLKECGLHLFK